MSTTRTWLWDLETGPLFPTDRTIEMAGRPFAPPPHPGTFDPLAVKHGRTLDPIKRQAKEDECRLKHEQAVADYEQTVEAARIEHAEKILSHAALSSITGQVLLGGFQCYETGDRELFYRPDSSDAELDGPILEAMAEFISRLGRSDRLIGWNTHGYDCPFLVRRGARLTNRIGSIFRARFYQPRKVGTKWINPTKNNIDLMAEWLLGNRSAADGEAKLNSVARHFGHPGKCGDGAGFWKLWLSDRSAAISYNVNDLEMLRVVAVGMEVLEVSERKQR